MSNIAIMCENALYNQRITRNDLINYLQDTSYPLEERWIIFEAYGKELLELDREVQHLEKINRIDELYDIDRYETVYYVDFIEWAEAKLKHKPIYAKEAYEFLSKLNMEDLKEEILSKGKSGFINDW